MLDFKGIFFLTKLNKKLAAKKREFSNKFKPLDKNEFL